MQPGSSTEDLDAQALQHALKHWKLVGRGLNFILMPSSHPQRVELASDRVAGMSTL